MTRPGPACRLAQALTVVYVVSTLTLASVAYTPLPNWLARPLLVEPAITQADVIVVLGGGTAPDRSPDGLRRLVWAIRLDRNGWARRILFSSGDPLGRGISEARALATVALELGVPPEVILLEECSWRTAEHGPEVARLLRRHGLSRVLLVTTPLHMRRAVGVFSRTHLTVLPAPTDGAEHAVDRPWERLHLGRNLVHEYLGLLYYRWQG